MDASLGSLREHLLEGFCPAVLVLSTEGADEIVFKNDLTFAQLLRPFGTLDTQRLVETTKPLSQHLVENFRVRFIGMSDLKPYEPHAVNDHLVHTCRVSYHPQASIEDMAASNLQLRDGVDYTPWFSKARLEYLRSFSCSEHETFDHPIACLVFASAHDVNCGEQVRNLFNIGTWPESFREFCMDPEFLKMVIVIEDDSNPDRLENGHREGEMGEVRRLFGGACHFIHLNSQPPDEQSSAMDDIWSNGVDLAYLEHTPRGRYLSPFDRTRLHDFVQDLMGNKILGFISGVVKETNKKILTSRKGFKNRLSNWWKGKKGSGPSLRDHQGNGIRYSPQSSEFKLRRMGDLLFMIGDFESAYNCYRTVASDFKDGRAHKYFAGANEFAALCCWLSDGSRKDIESYFDTAFKKYSEFDARGLMQRSLYLRALWHVGRREWEMAADFMFRAASWNDSAILMALFMEQCAFLRLRDGPGFGGPNIQKRKFCFHMAFSGFRYANCELREISLRCYTLANIVYGAKSWHRITQHLNIHLGRCLRRLGHLDEALCRFHQFLINCQGTPAEQEQFLIEFMNMYRQLAIEGGNPVGEEFIRASLPRSPRQGHEPVLFMDADELAEGESSSAGTSLRIISPLSMILDNQLTLNYVEIPTVCRDTVQVLVDTHGQTHPLVQAESDQEWRRLEEVAIAELEEIAAERLKSDATPLQASSKFLKADFPFQSFAGNPVFVGFEFFNPLDIPITLADICLQGRYVVHKSSDTQFTLPASKGRAGQHPAGSSVSGMSSETGDSGEEFVISKEVYKCCVCILLNVFLLIRACACCDGV